MDSLTDLARHKHEGPTICKEIIMVAFRFFIACQWFNLARSLGSEDYSEQPADQARQLVVCKFLNFVGIFWVYLFFARVSKQYHIKPLQGILLTPTFIASMVFAFVVSNLYVFRLWYWRFNDVTYEQIQLPSESRTLRCLSTLISIYFWPLRLVIIIAGFALCGIGVYFAVQMFKKHLDSRRNAWQRNFSSGDFVANIDDATMRNLEALSEQAEQTRRKEPAIDMPTLQSLKRGLSVLIRDQEEECAICCEFYQRDEDLIKLECGGKHIFHFKCMRQWIETGKDTCPLCREPFKKNL